MTKLFSIVVIAAAAACGGKTAGSAAPVGNLGGPAVAGLDQAIRRIDWRNRTYDGITVIDGAIDLLYDAQDNEYTPAQWDARYPGQDPVARGWVVVGDPIYADLDRDGREDALISIATNTGGTGKFDSIQIFTLRDGAPVVIDSIPGGDRADGGIGGISIDASGDILVERYVNLGDGACCPRASQHECGDGPAAASPRTSRAAPAPRRSTRASG